MMLLPCFRSLTERVRTSRWPVVLFLTVWRVIAVPVLKSGLVIPLPKNEVIEIEIGQHPGFPEIGPPVCCP